LTWLPDLVPSSYRGPRHQIPTQIATASGDIVSSVVELSHPETKTRDTPEKQGYGVNNAIRLGIPGQAKKRLERGCQINDCGVVVAGNGVSAIVPGKRRQDPFRGLGCGLLE
jgi:hypothetical protein